MDENNDFVIITGAPVPPPVPEETPAETAAETHPVTEEPVANEVETHTVVSDGADQAGEPLPEEPAANEVPEETPAEKASAAPEQEPAAEAVQDEPAEPTLADIAALIAGLEKKFDAKIAVDEYKNGLFDKLYKERDEYKNDFYGKLLKPFITSTIDIINDLRMFIAKIDTFGPERAVNYLKSMPDELSEMLVDNGVELFSDESDTFNPRTQRAKRIVETDDAALNNKIAERLEKGYLWNGVFLRPEMVAVYKFKQQNQ